MKILGIDPGTKRIGWGLVEINKNNFKALDFGLFKIKKNNKLEIYQQALNLIKRAKPDLVALEKIYFFKNQKTIIEVAKMSGVIALAAENQAVDIKELTPLEVKKIIASYGRADKKGVEKMIKILLGIKNAPKPDDVVDALAIALAAGFTSKK